MNIFILSEDPVEAAIFQCDKHVVKMIVESAQMLSTAHRMLDGMVQKRLSKSGKTKIRYYRHPNDFLENVLYKAVHHNHPCTQWTRESRANYQWHYEHFCALCDEYEYRYGRKHATDTLLRGVLFNAPMNIPSIPRTPFRLAMKDFSECMYENDPIRSYREFYQTKQNRFSMKWTKRKPPDWFRFTNK